MNYKVFINEEYHEKVMEILGETEGILLLDIPSNVTFPSKGYLYMVSADLLWRMDQIFLTPLFERKKLAENDEEDDLEEKEEDIYYYDKNESPNDNMDFYDKETFDFLREKNKLGRYDMHLLYPCSLEEFDETNAKAVQSKLIKKFFDNLVERNNVEFKSEFVKTLKRYFLGYFTLYIKIGDKKYPQMAMATLAKHGTTELGVLNISIVSGLVPGHCILEWFCARRIYIEKSDQTVEQWMEEMGIRLYGSPKSLILTNDGLDDESILNALVGEEEPSGKINGSEFVKKLNENLAQYNTAKAYASELCLLELEKKDKWHIINRIPYQTVELFFMELLLLQDAAISRLSGKISTYLNDESKDMIKAYDDILDELVSESSQAFLFFDLDEFLFPTVRVSAEKISKCFGMDRKMKMYEQNKDILSQLLDLRDHKREKIENDALNAILLLLAFAEVLPLFSEISSMIMAGTFTKMNLFSYMSGIAACFVIWIIYRVRVSYRNKTKKHKKKRSL